MTNLYRDIRDRSELEREYSPSRLVPDLDVYVNAYRQRSERARQEFPPSTHQYGPGAIETLDVFAAPAKPAPALLYFHGGYWQRLGKSFHSLHALPLHRNGFALIVPDYGLAPDATLDQMVDRCRRAVAWVLANASDIGVDPKRLHLCGSSAGAHLAAMAALSTHGAEETSAHIRSLILLSGVFDLRPIVRTYVNDALALTPEDALRNSPLLLLDTNAFHLPPALVAFAEHETSEFKRQSQEFTEHLLRKGAKSECREIETRNHFDLVLDIGEEETPFGARMLDWMRHAV